MNPYNPFILKLFFFSTAVSMVVACSGSRHTNIERGTEYNYTRYETKDGHPELRISAMGYLNEEGIGVINVAADIENRSLVFRHLDGKTTADIDIVITVVSRETDEERHLERYSETQTIENGSYSHIIRSDVTRYENDIEVPPGAYTVFVSVTDQASDSETVREVYAVVPDPVEEVVSLTPVQLFGKQPDKTYEPVTTYDVSTKNDSIRFVVQVTNNRPETPLLIRSKLIRFEADTSVARPASFPNYSVSSLPYKGIDYRNEENLEQTQRILDPNGVVMIEFYHERPERGNYRFEVTAGREDGEEELIRGRDFSVKGDNFPRVESPRELAEPLVYLMNEKEHEELMAIEDPDELKEAVDRFWLENIGSISRARQVIARYYERVEEANRQFTGFKEGWKTDRGMIYVLFGPPAHIEEWLNAQQWIGSYETRDARYNFFFERTRRRNHYFPFDNYILQRNQRYHTYQYQQVQLWVTGQILEATL